MSSKVMRRKLFQSLQNMRNPKFQKYSEFFEKSQWSSQQELKNYQLEKLTKLIKHSYENVPYYKEMFHEKNLQPDDIRKIEDLEKIKITQKETMKKGFESKSVIAKNFSDYNAKVVKTSGSTGSPLTHLRGNKSTIISEALMLRYYRWMNVEQGHKQVLLWGRSARINAYKIIRKKAHRALRGITEFHTHGWGKRDYLECIKIIKRIKPEIIRGYTPNIFLIANIARELGIEDITLKGVSTTAQTLFEVQRKIIEDQFNCKIFDQYGGSESLIAACECEEHCGYHVMDEHVILELVDGEGLPDGVKKIVITDLDNWAQPFIRYENGDLAESLEGYKCKCGRGLSMIKSIKGRTQDIVVSQNERYFTLHPFTSLFYNFLGIDQFQIIQDTRAHITIKIVKNNNLLEKDISFIKNKLDTLLQGSLSYTIEYVEEIKTSGTDKLKILISNLNDA